MRMASIIAIVLLLSGCVPIPRKHYYMSLAEVDGLEVVEYGTTSRTSFLQKPVPIHYRLSRASYFVELELEKLESQPAFRVSAASTSGNALLIQTRDDERFCSGWSLGLSNQLRVGENNFFMWTVMGNAKCLAPGEVGAERFAIAFKVVDAEGNILGEERLPFTVERNGFVVIFDAI